MTSLFDLDANSSDSEEDIDYVPDENVSDVSISDDGASDDESPKKSKSSRKSQNISKNTANDSDKTSSGTGTANVTKEKADDIWKSFLSEVEQTPTKAENNGLSGSDTSKSSVEKCTTDQTDAKQASNSPGKESTETLEFAGETITVSKDGSIVDILSSDKDDSEGLKNKANTSTTSEDTGTPPKRKGLQSVLGTLMNKKQKITTLQKSLIDWKSYKKEEGIEEDLQNFNRGKGGFIERQRFLERSNFRNYEMERDLRLSKAKK